MSDNTTNQGHDGPPMMFKLAERGKVPMKLALSGVSGSGKTYSAILLAHGLAGNDPQKVLVIDTENDSAALYSHLGGGFLHYCIRPPFEPRKYVEVIRQAVAAGVTVIVIDSLTHAWRYILDFKDRLDRQNPRDSYTNWGKAKSLFGELKDVILQSPVHIVACMRSKSEYVIEERQTSQGSKSSMKKVGMSPILEPDVEYDFSVLFELDKDTHQASVGGGGKDRTDMFAGKVFTITQATGVMILEWLDAKPGDILKAGDEWNRIQAGPSAEFQAASSEASGSDQSRPAESMGQKLTRIIPDAFAAFQSRATAGQVSWSKVVQAAAADATAEELWAALDAAIWDKVASLNGSATGSAFAHAMKLTEDELAKMTDHATSLGLDIEATIVAIGRGGGRSYDDCLKWFDDQAQARKAAEPVKPAGRRGKK